MHRRLPSRWALGAVTAAAVVAAEPRHAQAVGIPTIYDNYQSYPIGSRAAGMGGAYTALGCDEAALHYNPAALGCAAHSRLELAANVYQLQQLSIPDALGKGQSIQATTFNSIPSIVGGVYVLLDGDEDGAGRLGIGLSEEVPHSVAIKAKPAEPERPNYLSFSVRDDLTTADVGLGYQLHRVVALGLSVGAAVRTYEAHYNLLVVSRERVACAWGVAECWEFYASALEQEALAIGARAKLGVRVTPTDELSLGLAALSPSIDIYGTASMLQTNAVAMLLGGDPNLPIWGPYPVRLSGSSDLSLPFRLALGGAYSTSGFSISLDASVNFPHTVDVAYDLDDEHYEGFDPLTEEEIADHEASLERGLQPNVNLGIEVGLSDEVVLDAGAFTDLSSVTERDEDRIHMFGGTLALGLLGKQVRTWFGLSFELGMAEVDVAGSSLDLDCVMAGGLELDRSSTATRWTLAGILGSSYSFLAEDEEGKAPDGPARTQGAAK